MYIMGISCYFHASAVALIKDGKIVCAAEEERFTRKKHDNRFPANAIKFCLKYGKIKGKDLDHICFYEKPILKFQRIINQHIQMAPHSYNTFYKFVPSWTKDKLNIEEHIRNATNFKGQIHWVQHHQSHAASSFFISPFSKAAFLTIDGVGEWATTTFGVGIDNHIKILKEIHFPHSLGLLYSTLTAYLGFTVNNSEYKVMGLSPYGDSNPYYEKFLKLMDIKEDGSFALNMKYFDFHYKPWMPSKEMCKLFDMPVRKKEGELTQKHKDISASLQRVTEEVIFKMLHCIHKETAMNNLVLGGGCALNSVANGKILKNTPFKKIFIQPAAGDGGNSIGAALFYHHQILGNKKRYVQEHAFLGPKYTNKEIKDFLDSHFIKYSRFKDKKTKNQRVAKLIFKDNVVGWFQGRMEWGPRALGSRSILSNPCNPNMQEILNLKVKHREKFRPFAPVVCEDDALTYFECDEPVPLPTDYMLMVYPVREEWRKKIPAVTHVDGSGRLQTIRREQNPDYYDTIKEFGKLSKIPILINTSFNIRGEPIVCSPKEAYNCMLGTGIDCLVAGHFLIKRNDNPEDKWDSEALAND